MLQEIPHEDAWGEQRPLFYIEHKKHKRLTNIEDDNIWHGKADKGWSATRGFPWLYPSSFNPIRYGFDLA